jgi:hypothetical protein
VKVFFRSPEGHRAGPILVLDIRVWPTVPRNVDVAPPGNE